MKILETINKIKLLFAEEVAPIAPSPVAEVEPVKQTVPTYETTEGKILSIETLENGGIVTFDNVPVEDGLYSLVDGTSFKTVGGVIEDINKPVIPAVAEQAQEAAPVAPAPEDGMKKQLEAMAAKFSAVADDKIKFENNLNAKLEKQENIIKEMFAAIEIMSNQSVEKPLEDSSNFLTENYKTVLKSRGKFN